jgi:hypothetical protein
MKHAKAAAKATLMFMALIAVTSVVLVTFPYSLFAVVATLVWGACFSFVKDE